MSRRVPAERWQAFTSVAAASQTKKVLIVCRSRAVQRQYEAAVARLGGRPENLTFQLLDAEDEASDA